MISTLAAACVILLSFRHLMIVACDPRVDWDVPPLWLLLITMIVMVHFREMLHRRLS